MKLKQEINLGVYREDGWYRLVTRRSFHLKDQTIMNDFQSLIPQHKSDLERANAAVVAGYPTVAPILLQLLEWLQDYNWPVAKVLTPFFISIGKPLIPPIQHVMNTDDNVWKYWVMDVIMWDSYELTVAFQEELERLAWSPTDDEVAEELDRVAQEVLDKHKIGSIPQNVNQKGRLRPCSLRRDEC